ncbi:MAG: hypothetical protein EOP83_23710 [Verrucomicrobiaceae bacterium]|nr:MAG: hypothetical protein EOP83_23710 [Verrucomicrobiaceae bacterium]
MKNNRPILGRLLGGVLAVISLFGAQSSAAPSAKAYQFTSSVANTTGGETTLNHPALNGKPKLNPILSRRWTSVYNTAPLGLRYNASAGRWVVQTQDGSAIPNGLNFDILLAPGAKRVISSALNSEYNRTYSAVAANKPAALVQATHMRNPSTLYDGVAMTKPFGVWFDSGKWSIYTEDSSAMPAVAFNMVDVTNLKSGTTPATFLHTATVGNISSYVTYFNHPLSDGNPNASVFVTHAYGLVGPYLNEQFSVYYAGGDWAIFNEDGTAMPVGSKFIVTVVPTPTP